ncbi:DNA polymerase zeta catalytic subunit [Caerostris extrusa]|uniref:DNA polymerase zeta catalytic subunit n=1 Tax=Caerostris extrusa TaxID=172846 RepID=A0AAV4XG10_CAEEX|nr:DNA polymerase zeta catalytic subunit [Caerostris extrusa]
MSEPFEENKRPKILSQQSTNLVENVSSSDIDGPTLLNSLDSQVGIDDCLLSTASHYYELGSSCLNKEYLDPDPKFDPVVAIFYSIYEDVKTLKQNCGLCDPADSMFHDGVQKDNNVVTDQIEVDQIKIAGRIILNFWRLLTKEITFKELHFEKVYHHALHRRRPHYSFQDLTRWFHGREKETVVEYYTVYVLGVMQILDKLDIIRRTSELARLFGIQFYDVLSRGSQFRVESMMLRIATSMDYIPVSLVSDKRSQSRPRIHSTHSRARIKVFIKIL